jgi:hypothetical protein
VVLVELLAPAISLPVLGLLDLSSGYPIGPLGVVEYGV